MQSLINSAASLGPRALSNVTGKQAASQSFLYSLLAPAVSWALRLPSCSSSSSDTASTSEVTAPWGSRALQTTTSAHGGEDAITLRSSNTGSSTLPPAVLSQRSPLLLDGSRGADPGELRYTAPYWIPEDVRKANHLPQVLFTDPWPSHDEPEIRRRHARLCYNLLLHSPRPLTAEQVRDAVNDSLREQHSAAAAATADSQSQSPPPPLLASTAYVKQLLEHMRRTRLLYGKKNPESMLSGGHPEHPRLYHALKYQAERFGNPNQLAEQDAVRREKRVQLAFKRLRHGKPPYAIHRRRAYFSIWQHELSQAALRGEGLPHLMTPP
ncbi:hypothetical protein Vretimale_14761 [Volvox reticuliferus]|uniref:Uncharacterized protein n=1 Tax=Volvox reticuliferus TaxID=1737510 RepID=A0A8J4GQ83_9CHLO|nr:hypothetical protein Vretifemale_15599 [Volvox reticuliferus]GIM11207.1 hypothetical protein Vretimale_14761 [Volvox reticuliferus]